MSLLILDLKIRFLFFPLQFASMFEKNSKSDLLSKGLEKIFLTGSNMLIPTSVAIQMRFFESS